MYYYIDNNNQQIGPMSKQMLLEKNIHEYTYVWRGGMSNWMQVKDVPELYKELIEKQNKTADFASYIKMHPQSTIAMPHQNRASIVNENKTSLADKVLSNMKWFLLPGSVIMGLMAFEMSTDSYGVTDSEFVYVVFALVLVFINVMLFVCDSRYKHILHSLLDKLLK